MIYGVSAWRTTASRASLAHSLARPLSSLPSFLPSSRYGFPSRECISPVIFSSTVARCRGKMLQRTPLTRLRRKSSASQLLRALLQYGSRSGTDKERGWSPTDKCDRHPWILMRSDSDALIAKYRVKNICRMLKHYIISIHENIRSFKVDLFLRQFCCACR